METNELIQRWRNAAQHAEEEQVRILAVNGEYRATSSSRPLGSYLLHKTPHGWACECPANSEHGVPCKHLSALADLLDLDVLSDMRVNWMPDETDQHNAA